MRTQETNGYVIYGNDYAAVAISLTDEADSHAFTLGNQAAYNQAVVRAEQGPSDERSSYIVDPVDRARGELFGTFGL